jgi:putative glutathione S-transferase
VPPSPRVADPADFETHGSIYQPRGPLARPLVGPQADRYPFKGRIGEPEFPAEGGRYHLYVSYACPYAHRALIIRALYGLEEAVSVSVVDPIRDGRGWAFRHGDGITLDTGGRGFAYLSEAYDSSSPGGVYSGHVSVPALWDKHAGRIVSNHYPTIYLDLANGLRAYATRNRDLDLAPAELAETQSALAEHVAWGLNQGVYRAGFTASQTDHDAAVEDVYATLDQLEKELTASCANLLGEQLTFVDVQTWVTLVRFDPVYYGHFKLARRQLRDYPALWAYARRLMTRAEFRDTTKLDQIIRHYYGTQRHINPTGIIPDPPQIDWSYPND